MTTEFDSPKELIISHFVSLVAVPLQVQELALRGIN